MWCLATNIFRQSINQRLKLPFIAFTQRKGLLYVQLQRHEGVGGGRGFEERAGLLPLEDVLQTKHLFLVSID